MAITYRASSTATADSTSVACNYPTGTAVGDYVLAFVFINKASSGTISFTTPSGWTLIDTSAQSTNGTTTRLAIFGRFYASGSSQTFATTGPNGIRVNMASCYGVDPTTPVEVSTTSIDTTSKTAHTFPTATTTFPNTQLFWLHGGTNPGAFGVVTHSWGATGSPTEIQDAGSQVSFAYWQSAALARATFAGTGTTPAATVTTSANAASNVYGTVALREEVLSATVNGTDDAAATDAADALTVTTGVATDTASGTESSSQTVSRSPDTALASESASTVTAATGFRTDTAAATDSWTTLVASVPGTDTAATTESAYVSNAIQVSDTAVAAEAASVVRVSGSADAATATDKALPFPFDYVVGGESPSSLRVSGSEDTATASDSAFATNAAQASPDAATVTENSSKVYQSRSDSAVGTDSSSLTATANGSDSAAVTESARIIIVVTGDSAAGSESSKVFLTRVDTAAETDAATIAVTVFGSDSAGAVETSIESNRSASDQFVWTESAFKSISGQLQASRLVVVQPESRVVTVDFEGEYTPDTYGIVSETVVGEDVIAGTSKIARRIIVEREFRLVMIGAEV